MSVVFGNVPLVWQDDKDNFAIVEDETTLIFINSGTRSAAVTGVSIFFIQHDGVSRCGQTSTGNDGAWFATTFEPLAVKPNEVATQRIKIARPHSYTPSKRNDAAMFLFPISAENKLKKRADVEVCYAIYLATPSVATHVEHVSGIEYQIEELMTLSDPIDIYKPPRLLLKSSGTIFGE